MDAVTKELQALLVRMHYNPTTVSHQMEHYVSHLVRLLPPADEETLLHYFGILGHEQLSLHQIACDRGEDDETTMDAIDRSLRRLAVTPEWEMLRTIKKEE